MANRESEPMNATAQRLCAWCGPAWMFLFFVGFLIAGFLVPPSPAESAAQVVARFSEHTNAIRFGMWLNFYAAALCIPWVAVIAVQLKRIEGRFAPFTYCQLILGAGYYVFFMIPMYFWMVAAFRPETRSPEIMQTLMDLGWLPFTGAVYTFEMQAVILGIAVLMDKREQPVFPRWFGYFNLWCALLWAPSGLDIFFPNGGLLAWNGLFAWWMAVVTFFAWLVVLTALLLKAIRSQEAEAAEADTRPEVADVRWARERA